MSRKKAITLASIGTIITALLFRLFFVPPSTDVSGTATYDPVNQETSISIRVETSPLKLFGIKLGAYSEDSSQIVVTFDGNGRPPILIEGHHVEDLNDPDIGFFEVDAEYTTPGGFETASARMTIGFKHFNISIFRHKHENTGELLRHPN